ncbi:hypothetical protein OUHCRE13_14880 [Enterobacter roggenkampii]
MLARSARRRRHHRFKLLYDARLNEDARLVGLDRHVEHLGEHMMLQVRQPARAISLLGLQAATRRAAALRVAFD